MVTSGFVVFHFKTTGGYRHNSFAVDRSLVELIESLTQELGLEVHIKRSPTYTATRFELHLSDKDVKLPVASSWFSTGF